MSMTIRTDRADWADRADRLNALTRVAIGDYASEIKVLRDLVGWTQTQLAQAIGADVRRVRQWETGARSPSPRNVVILRGMARYGNAMLERIEQEIMREGRRGA